ncbi:Tectonic-3 [Intoshia linei]|uniref:Tectonic-3 n=1 Tax=Intoshia linei TaxID=1819745 RepID=A0A177B0N3_9BILA|nr:Tectonic-3 [Intoshia linei]
MYPILLLLLVLSKFKCQNTETTVATVSTTSTLSASLASTVPSENVDLQDSGEAYKGKTHLSNMVNDKTIVIVDNSTHPRVMAKKNITRSICWCDLTRGSCDTNCCCDPECSNGDIKSFTTCVNKASAVPHSCYYQDNIMFNNTDYMGKKVLNQLLCLYKDNYPKKEEYDDVSVIDDDTILIDYIHSQSNSFQFSLSQSNENLVYKVGDPLYVVDKNGYIMHLSFPTTTVYANCLDNGDISYLLNREVKCIRQLKDTYKQCNTLPALNPLKYYGGFKFIKVHYVFIYTNNGKTISFTDVTVNFVFMDLLIEEKHFQQFFKVTFQQKSDLLLEKIELSGNPGYIIGKPLVAGSLIKHADVDNIIRIAIQLLNDPHIRFTVLKSDSNNQCINNVIMRKSILFGENLRSGCYITLHQLNVTNSCQMIQNEITALLIGTEFPKYVASFGNSAVENVGDWIEIFMDSSPQDAFEDATIPYTCSNIHTGINIDVIYGKEGRIDESQNKIVGVAVRYTEPENIRFNCISNSCDGSNAHNAIKKIQIKTAVTFTNISLKPKMLFADIPALKIYVPKDFLYPFM